VLKSEAKTSKAGRSYFQVSYLIGDEVVKGMSRVDLSAYKGDEVDVELSVRASYGENSKGLDLTVEKVLE